MCGVPRQTPRGEGGNHTIDIPAVQTRNRAQACRPGGEELSRCSATPPGLMVPAEIAAASACDSAMRAWIDMASPWGQPTPREKIRNSHGLSGTENLLGKRLPLHHPQPPSLAPALSALCPVLAFHQQLLPCVVYGFWPAPLYINGTVMLSPNALRFLDALSIYAVVNPSATTLTCFTFVTRLER